MSDSHYDHLEMKNVKLHAIYTKVRKAWVNVTNHSLCYLHAKLLVTKPYSYVLKAEF
jgi:hypothetical protein